LEGFEIGLEDFCDLSKRNLGTLSEKWILDLKFPRLWSINLYRTSYVTVEKNDW